MTNATELTLPVPNDAEQQAFLDTFQGLLTSGVDPGITLTNIYKEIPITHSAYLSSVNGSHIELSTSELQLAAMGRCKEVYIRSPHFATPVLGRLDSIDIRRQSVRLSHFSRVKADEDNRKSLRVRFKRPISIVMHSANRKISGVIHDISLGGCCVSTLVGKELGGSGNVEVELKLIDQATDQLRCMRIASLLFRVHGETPPFKCALSFQHTPQSEQFLSVFINQRQREILKELREAL
jgi:c-di-GMP-binding flagellar brake protein YcgR